MSKALDNAELIRTRLLTAPVAGEIPTALDITEVEVIIDRQKSVLTLVQTAVAKASGTAIVILWDGWVVLDKNNKTPRLAHRYVVSVWSKPVIAGDNLAADEVMEAVINRLWHWRPVGAHAFGEAVPGNGGLVPNNKYLIYDCEVVIPVSH